LVNHRPHIADYSYIVNTPLSTHIKTAIDLAASCAAPNFAPGRNNAIQLAMTKLLEKAIAAVRDLPADRQDRSGWRIAADAGSRRAAFQFDPNADRRLEASLSPRRTRASLRPQRKWPTLGKVRHLKLLYTPRARRHLNETGGRSFFPTGRIRAVQCR